ncbi:MAG: oligopeptide/dipeptide ABC transporter ATP-binding protein [Faecalibacillus faecis]
MKNHEMLELVGLSREHATRYPHQFSGGQRQRIGIARALIMNPDLIIADEAISALDVSIQAQVVNLMKKIQKETGIAYLFIAHDLSMVKYISDKIGVLHLGHLVETGTTEEIFDNPIHPYTKSLLSAIPHPNPRVEKVRKSFA